MNKIVHYSDSPRVGRFCLPAKLKEDRDLVRALLASCTTILSHAPVSGGEEFYAVHPMFDELLEGEEIPSYRIDFFSPGEEPPEHKPFTSEGLTFSCTRQFILRVPTVEIRASAVSLA